jgi:hypothetical protein
MLRVPLSVGNAFAASLDNATCIDSPVNLKRVPHGVHAHFLLKVLITIHQHYVTDRRLADWGAPHSHYRVTYFRGNRSGVEFTQQKKAHERALSMGNSSRKPPLDSRGLSYGLHSVICNGRCVLLSKPSRGPKY